MYGRYFGLPRQPKRERADRPLAFAPWEDRADTRVDALSGGMRRRPTTARSVISEPDVLVPDEPTTGPDPQARHALWERLYELKERGVTLTGH
ncbi:hypothetical protein GCM10020295_08040 [Streptomyces cinereospinus]